MSGTTPDNGAEDGPQRDPFSQPAGRPERQPWRENEPPSWGSSPAGQPEPGQLEPGQRPQPPSAILTAVKLMYVGAVLQFLFGLLDMLNSDGRREWLAEQNPDATAAELEALAATMTTTSVVVHVVSVGLWIWMAWANKRGRSWARVVSTVLGGLNIMFFGFGALMGGINASTVIGLISPVLAAVILYMLYRPESGEFYRKMSSKVF